MLFGASFLIGQEIYSQNTPIKNGEATNCTYTGNPSDYCNASNGTNNLKVINCRPGETSCQY